MGKRALICIISRQQDDMVRKLEDDTFRPRHLTLTLPQFVSILCALPLFFGTQCWLHVTRTTLI